MFEMNIVSMIIKVDNILKLMKWCKPANVYSKNAFARSL